MTEVDDLITSLRSASSSVFRFEGRQNYPDDPQWQGHQKGDEWERNEDLIAWRDLVRANRSRGVTMTRVHVVTTPWTAYLRFEIEQHYPHNIEAGEDVRLVHADETWRVDDFWLVDDEDGWVLTYDAAGGMTVAAASPEAVPALREWRDRALDHSSALTISAVT